MKKLLLLVLSFLMFVSCSDTRNIAYKGPKYVEAPTVIESSLERKVKEEEEKRKEEILKEKVKVTIDNGPIGPQLSDEERIELSLRSEEAKLAYEDFLIDYDVSKYEVALKDIVEGSYEGDVELQVEIMADAEAKAEFMMIQVFKDGESTPLNYNLDELLK